MANSSLRRTGEKAPVVDKGHGTKALGPSDRSDTGSDITGAPGLNEETDTLGLQPGTTSDPDHNLRGSRKTAGPDIGDENLDSDSDSGGTGERAAAGRDAPPANDQQLTIVDADGNELRSEEVLQEDLVEDDRELGSEDAPDVMEEDTPRGRRAHTASGESSASKPRSRTGGARPKARSRPKR